MQTRPLPALILGLGLLHSTVDVRTVAGADIQANTYTTGSQSGPDATVAADGTFVIVWGSDAQDGDLFGVFAQRFDNQGARVGTEFQVNSTTTGGQYAYGVAGGADGAFTVIWGGPDGSFRGIFGQRFDSGGTPAGSEFQVNIHTTGPQFAATIASDAEGDFVVVWTDADNQDGSGYGIFAQRYQSSGALAGTEFQVNTNTTGNQFLATVSGNAAGDFVVVWSSDDGFDYGVFGQRFASSGAAAGTEFQVNTTTAYSQWFADVSVGDDGAFVVAWDDNSSIFGQRYDSSGVPAGTEALLSVLQMGRREFAEVSMDSDGGFMLAWQSESEDGFGDGVLAQQYDSSGQAVGTEFLVPSQFNGHERFPISARGANGDLLVAWSAFDHDGSGTGVFAKRYVDGVVACDPAPDPACIANFTKAKLLLKETPGHEKLFVKIQGGALVTQTDFGNPVAAGGTAYRICVYDDGPQLVADMLVDRGGTSSWTSIGPAPPAFFGKGYTYDDDQAGADGIAKIMVRGGATSSSVPKILIKGRGAALPPIAATLTTTSSVTVQLRGDDAPSPGCFSTTLTTITKQTADTFKAK